jgi:type IV secretion system protein VirB5
MRTRLTRFLVAPLILAPMIPAAQAQFAVIDAASVTQLVSEVRQLEQQVATARNQLLQAQAEFQTITGNRGLQSLLSGTVRNYLPADWATLQGALRGSTGAASSYPALAADVTQALSANAVLSPQQLAALPPAGGASLQAGRQSSALLQAVAHEALANSSGRFATLQQLIDAIGSTNDQKSVLELQARTAAELSMLQNEHTKLQDLYQSVQADRWATAQRTRESIVAGHGQFVNRFQPQP